MSGGTFARVLAALVLIGVLVAIGVGVYNAGVSAGLATTVAAPSGAPVAYYPGPYAWHGWGWGPGWGFFGIFFWILGIFLIFGLLRAVFGWGRWGGRGYRDWNHRPNGYAGPESRFEEWHRRMHQSGSSGSPGSPGPGASAGGAGGEPPGAGS
jgi:hypothetical protein